MAKIDKKGKMKSTNNPSLSKIKLKSAGDAEIDSGKTKKQQGRNSRACKNNRKPL